MTTGVEASHSNKRNLVILPLNPDARARARCFPSHFKIRSAVRAINRPSYKESQIKTPLKLITTGDAFARPKLSSENCDLQGPPRRFGWAAIAERTIRRRADWTP
jgi:hypothetical protein